MRLRILLIFLLVGTEYFGDVVKNVRGSLCDMCVIKFILGVVFLLILQSLDNRLAISGVQKIVCDVRDAFHAFVVAVLIRVVIESQAVEFGSNIEESFAGYGQHIICAFLNRCIGLDSCFCYDVLLLLFANKKADLPKFGKSANLQIVNCTNTKSACVDGIYRTNTILGGSHILASKKCRPSEDERRLFISSLP